MGKKGALFDTEEFNIENELNNKSEKQVKIVESKPTHNIISTVAADEEQKKKVGRPKTKPEECKNINIAIPLSLLEKMEIAKECYSKNMTLYINTLIEKDLEQNFEKYQTICEQLKQLNMV